MIRLKKKVSLFEEGPLGKYPDKDLEHKNLPVEEKIHLANLIVKHTIYGGNCKKIP